MVFRMEVGMIWLQEELEIVLGDNTDNQQHLVRLCPKSPSAKNNSAVCQLLDKLQNS